MKEPMLETEFALLPSESEVESYWQHDDKVYISIVCTTYNHSAYINKTLESFIRQTSSYRFEIIVHDDASPDNTPDIIRAWAERYPKLIKPILQTQNQKSLGNSSMMIASSAASGDYIALCEGDDYWIDDRKIEKQCSLMVNDNAISLVHTDCNLLFNQTGLVEKSTVPRRVNGTKELLFANGIHTCTVMIKTKVILDFIEKHSHSFSEWRMMDYPMWLFASICGDLVKLEDSTAVYRILTESASHSLDEKKKLSFIKSSIGIRRYFSEALPKRSFMRRFISLEMLIVNQQIQDLECSGKGNANFKSKLKRAFLYVPFDLLVRLFRKRTYLK